MTTNPVAAPNGRVVILPASWRDLNALRAIEQACFPKDAWPLLDLIGVLTLPNVIRLKAICAGKMVGFIASDLRRAEGLAWIATIGVLPGYRQRGVGTALLQACEARLEMPLIRLSVRASNHPALRLYNRLGYRQYDIWPRYYSDGEDAILLEKGRGTVVRI
jgi:ribosomal-protein-alanine N-acetyltransferase